jgi:hypothetical protein
MIIILSVVLLLLAMLFVPTGGTAVGGRAVRSA